MRWWWVALFLSGCVSVSQPVRGPAAQAISPGGLSEEEERACDGFNCKYFIAPCSLHQHSSRLRAPNVTGPQRYTSLKDEAYLGQLKSLLNAGFCQMPTRKMPEELYNHD